MTDYPKISIVTPSFNQGRFIEKTILSVIEQNYPNLEYIIIDGGSTDESIEIIKKYEKHLAYWVSEPDRGQSHAINKGFERATGEIFGWLNSDDYFMPKALLKIAEVYPEHPDAGAFVGAGEMIDEEGNTFHYISRKEINLQTLYSWYHEFFWQPSCFFTKTAWQKCGPLDETINFALDVDLWIKIAKQFSFITIDENLSRSLKHSKAKTTEFSHLSNVEVMLLTMEHGGKSEGRSMLEQYTGYLVKSKRDLEMRVEELERELDETSKQLTTKENYIKVLLDSYSWKLTSPLRKILDILKK